MRKIEDLERKLYGEATEKEFEERKIGDLYEKKDEKDRKTKSWEEMEKEEAKIRPKINWLRLIKKTLTVAVILVAVGGAIWYIIRPPQRSFVLKFATGPAVAKAGDFRKIDLVYQNRGGVDIKDAKIYISLPDLAELRSIGGSDFSKEGPYYVFNIGDVIKKREGRLSFDVRFWGAEGQDQTTKARFNYRYSDSSSFYDEEQEFVTKIEGSVFSLKLSGPPNAVDGKQADVFIEYSNDGNADLENMRIQLEYPEGFAFDSSDLAPSISNNTWDLDTLSVGEVGKIRVRGIISGYDGERKKFKAYLGAKQDSTIIKYAAVEYDVSVSTAILYVYQTSQNSRDPIIDSGGLIEVRVQYKNMTSFYVSGVVIKVKLIGDLYDLETLNVNYGIYDPIKQELVWESRGVPGNPLNHLGPKQEGEVTYSIRTKRTYANGYGDKNFTVSSVAKIDASGIPASLGGVAVSVDDTLQVKVNTDAKLYQKAYYFPPFPPYQNSGPLPPRVGQTTTYTLVWDLTNTTNDIRDAKVETKLPIHIKWLGQVYPATERVDYDESTGRVVWSPQIIDAGSGYYLPVRHVAFQVSLTPAPSFVGSSPELFSESFFSGQDDFTGKRINLESGGMTTNLKGLGDTEFKEDRWGIVVY